MSKIEELESKLKETHRFHLYCKVEDILLDGEGNIHLILSKDSPFLTFNIVKILKKYFHKRDVILILNYLIRDIKCKTREEVEAILNLYLE
jgi:hypothetical protein